MKRQRQQWAEAFYRLKEGNSRYRSGNPQHPGQTTERRTKLAKRQHPFAIILGCSDSRVPPEIIFDQGLGDLFVCRIAGNVINDESLGSIEYAVDNLGVRLIVEATAKDDLDATIKANVKHVVAIVALKDTQRAFCDHDDALI